MVWYGRSLTEPMASIKGQLTSVQNCFVENGIYKTLPNRIDVTIYIRAHASNK